MQCMSLFIMGVCAPSDTLPHSLACPVMFQNGSSLRCLLAPHMPIVICDTAALPYVCVFIVICKESMPTQHFGSVVFDLLCFLLRFEYTCYKVEAHVRVVQPPLYNKVKRKSCFVLFSLPCFCVWRWTKGLPQHYFYK